MGPDMVDYVLGPGLQGKVGIIVIEAGLFNQQGSGKKISLHHQL
jgi:hypothetical protein